MRVLLIEDEPTTAKSIELMLGSEGFNVYTTDLGEEGLDLAKLYDYDIILLDLNLPDMHGYDVLNLDQTFVECAGETLVRLGIAGEQQASGSVAVETVDQRRRPLEPEAEADEMVLEARAGRRSGMDGEARRLVDNDRLGIDEKDPIRGINHRVSGSERHVNRPAMSAASAQRWRFSKDSMRLRRN